MTQVGQRIKRFRELKKIPMKDVAEKLGMTTQDYSRIERDEVSLGVDKLEVICEMLEMSIGELMADDKFVFNFHNNNIEREGSINGIQHNFPTELKKLYDDKIRLLEQLLEARDAEINRMKEQLKISN